MVVFIVFIVFFVVFFVVFIVVFIVFVFVFVLFFSRSNRVEDFCLEPDSDTFCFCLRDTEASLKHI